jgi:hypothetical protein
MLVCGGTQTYCIIFVSSSVPSGEREGEREKHDKLRAKKKKPATLQLRVQIWNNI